MFPHCLLGLPRPSPRVARGAAGGGAPHVRTTSRAASFACRESTRHPAMAARLKHHARACLPCTVHGSRHDRIAQAWWRSTCARHHPDRDDRRRAAAARQRPRALSAAPRRAAVLPAVGALGTLPVAAHTPPCTIGCKATAGGRFARGSRSLRCAWPEGCLGHAWCVARCGVGRGRSAELASRLTKFGGVECRFHRKARNLDGCELTCARFVLYSEPNELAHARTV